MRITSGGLLFLACIAGAVQAQDYALWKTVNKDGNWTLAAENAVKATTLVKLAPKDIQTFCPAYLSLDADQRTRFWVGLLSAMAKPESGFKPETKYVEPDIVWTPTSRTWSVAACCRSRWRAPTKRTTAAE